MVDIFIADVAPLEADEKFLKYLGQADPERQAKVGSLVVREKQNQSLAAGIILPLALKACGVAGKIEISNGDFGKPRLVSPRGLYYNVSHSGGKVVCALANGEVGCDIQAVAPVNLSVAKRYFSPEEYDFLCACEDKQEYFYRLWTVKESYLKALGTGLCRPLNSFTVRFTDGGTEIDDPEGDGGWFIKEYAGVSGYKIACCSRDGDFCGQVRVLTL